MHIEVMLQHDDLMQCGADLMQIKEGLRIEPGSSKVKIAWGSQALLLKQQSIGGKRREEPRSPVKSKRSYVKGPRTKAQGLIGLFTAKYIKFEI